MINFKNKKITVMGLGLHGGGLAVAKWMLKNKAQVCVTDLKTEKELEISVASLKKFAAEIGQKTNLKFHLGSHHVDDFIKSDLIIKNPGVPRNSNWLQLARENKIKIHNEASLFFNLCQVPVIAVTGSKGKSTTTALIGEIFKKAFPGSLVAGNIKTTPMFSIIDHVLETSRVPFVILELSSWQLELMPAADQGPQTAVITNIKPEHLNTYDSIEDYFQAKLGITKHQKPDDYVVLNFDDQRLRKFGQKSDKRVVWYSSQTNLAVGIIRKGNWLIWNKPDGQEKIFNLKQTKLLGQHNIENIMAVCAVAKVYKIKNDLIAKVISNFSGLPGRQEFVREFKGRKFYNDTTATAPVAGIAALDSFFPKPILIAGGTDKSLPVEEFADRIIKSVKTVILLPGTGTDKLLKYFKKNGFKNYYQTNSMAEAVNTAYRKSASGDNILLSPGFASFGLFVHEFDRGDQFVNTVKQLKE